MLGEFFRDTKIKESHNQTFIFKCFSCFCVEKDQKRIRKKKNYKKALGRNNDSFFFGPIIIIIFMEFYIFLCSPLYLSPLRQPSRKVPMLPIYSGDLFLSNPHVDYIYVCLSYILIVV